MKKIIFFLCIAIVLALLLLPTVKGRELRLRVIANSDSASDQAIKKEVVNAIDKKLDREKFRTLDGAQQWIEDNTAELKEVCAETLGNGKFVLEIKDEEYSDGVYSSLVITLGEGKGHNFWGTLFPNISESVSRASDKGKSFGVISRKEKLVEIRLWIIDKLIKNYG